MLQPRPSRSPLPQLFPLEFRMHPIRQTLVSRRRLPRLRVETTFRTSDFLCQAQG
jgi:hypothetical protein